MYNRDRFARAPFRIVAFAAVIAMLGSLVTLFAPLGAISVARAATWNVNTSARTEAEVRSLWSVLKPVYSGTPYAVTPSVVAPYAPGELTNGFRADGANMINFGRYLAGLPYDVTLNGTRNTNGQYGSVLLRAIGYLDHTPDKPADMDDAFYSIGYSATSSSNIGGGYTTSHSFQKGCLDDASASNLATVGHRRWLLNPRMLYSGIGYADGYHTTYAFDQSRPVGDVDYDVIAWPSAGVFPVEFASRLTPWSITLNPARYDWDATAVGKTATLRRVSDGRTWTMDAADTSTSGEYFSANFNGYGVPNVFIFRPNPADLPSGYLPGEQYDVTLSGGIYAEGTRTPVVVTYRTSFGTLSGAATVFSAPLAPGSSPLTPPVTSPTAPPTAPTTTPTPSLMPVYRFYNRVNGSHFYTASAEERDTVIAKWSATYLFEGPAYAINTANPVNDTPLYRFYNRVNGSHFYTASDVERDTIIAKWPAVFAYEGSVYNVSATAAGTTSVYRFYNKVNGSHFYTVSPEERDRVIAAYSATYTFEGVCYYIGN